MKTPDKHVRSFNELEELMKDSSYVIMKNDIDDMRRYIPEIKKELIYTFRYTPQELDEIEDDDEEQIVMLYISELRRLMQEEAAAENSQYARERKYYE